MFFNRKSNVIGGRLRLFKIFILNKEKPWKFNSKKGSTKFRRRS